jgi:hypothetical protein
MNAPPSDLMGVAQCCWRGDGDGLLCWASASNTTFCCTKITPDGVPGSDERAARFAGVAAAAAALLVVHAKGIISLLDLGALDDLKLPLAAVGPSLPPDGLGILDPNILGLAAAWLLRLGSLEIPLLPLLPAAGGNDALPLSPPVAASLLTLMGCSPSCCGTAELLPSMG